MKRFISLSIVVIMLLALTVNSFATANNNIVITYDNISVIFESDTEYTSEEQQYIADMLVYGESDIVMVQPRAWCWLTGHNKTTEYVTIITHKAYDNAPRCVSELYEVTTCANCDLYEMEIVSESRISCCAEE